MLGYIFLPTFTNSKSTRFEPAPVQVLLTEEISGSLRKLRVILINSEGLVLWLPTILQGLSIIFMQGCCNLARDRYKSIEKRGILAPSKSIRFVFVFHP
jgi:nucleolar protein 53